MAAQSAHIHASSTVRASVISLELATPLRPYHNLDLLYRRYVVYFFWRRLCALIYACPKPDAIYRAIRVDDVSLIGDTIVKSDDGDH